MKVMRVKSREYKGKKYYKYRINLPKEALKDAGFKEGDELKAVVKKGEMRLVGR